MPRKHVVISGTGRTGTTFLVQLLTNLGLETGFTPQNMTISENARAGLEHDIRNENAPYIVKNPWFCDYAEEVIKQDDIFIEHVFIPMRNLHAAAESRRYVVKNALSKMSLLKRFRKKSSKIDGGLWHTDNKREQENILLQQFYKLALSLSNTNIPVTLLHYPSIVMDNAYLYEKLKPILRGIGYYEFSSVFKKTVRLDLVHSFNEDDR
jgi:hypothetical protein